MRLEGSRWNRRNIVLNHIYNFIRVINYEFPGSFARPFKIREHFLGGFEIERRLVIAILKAH